MMLNPMMLPKVRSETLRLFATQMPCTLRICTFIGLSCGPASTNVMCHLPVHGKGIGTKVSDLHMACGCGACHDLLDCRDERGITIREKYPLAYYDRLLKAHAETLSRWVQMDMIRGTDWEIV